MSALSLDPDTISARLKTTREQLAGLRRQRDALDERRRADPYDMRLPQLFAQATHRVSVLEQQAASLERELRSNRPVDDLTDGLPSGQAWVGGAWGDSRSGSNS